MIEVTEKLILDIYTFFRNYLTFQKKHCNIVGQSKIAYRGIVQLVE